jgi:hypothetical protein
VIQLFQSKEGPAGVLGQNLIGGVADADGSHLPFTIGPRGHVNGLRRGSKARASRTLGLSDQ